MRTSNAPKGITLVEVFVFIFIALLLASIILPGFNHPTVRSPEAKALANARQIGLACKQYAIDNNGQYPTFIAINGATTSTRISDYSNTAFDQLFPAYLQTNTLFYQPKSAWTPTVIPESTKAEMDAGKSLPAGSNEWAYVTGLHDQSNQRFPLIADGFANLNTHAYSADQSALGGIWKGERAIVVFCDDSARVINCIPSTHTIPGSPNGADLFDTSGQQAWLTSTGTDMQTVLNPTPPAAPAKPPEGRKTWLFW